MGMDSFHRLGERFPWLDTVADDRRPARLLPLGTPIRPGLRRRRLRPPGSETRHGCARSGMRTSSWPSSTMVRAREKASRSRDSKARKADVLDRAISPAVLSQTNSPTDWRASRASSADAATYPLLSGTQPDFYRGFMCQTWAHIGAAWHCRPAAPRYPLRRRPGEEAPGSGISAAADARKLRQRRQLGVSRYRLGELAQFGMHIYGPPKAISCASCRLACYMGRRCFAESLRARWIWENSATVSSTRGTGTFVRTEHASSGWIEDRLALWQELLDRRDEPLDETPLVHRR